MGSLRQDSAPNTTLIMELFKACLLVSALAVFSSPSMAAPTEVVAGRVITHSAPAPVLLRHSPGVSTLHHSLHHSEPAVVHTLHHAAPVTLHDSLNQADLRARLRAALRDNPALLRSLNQVSPTTVHTIPPNQPAVVQTLSAPTAVHTLHHTAPGVVQTVHHAAAPAVIQAVRTSPTSVHALHHTTPAVVQAARTAPQAIHSLHHTAPVVTQVARAVPAVPVHVHDDGVLRIVIPAVHTLVTDETVNLHPQYSFGYSINDVNTGDSKTRQETRDGDVVTGSYSVADPDGRIRTVTYTADSVHGFQAKVTYDGEEGPVAIPFYAPRAPLVSTTVPAAPAPLVSTNVLASPVPLFSNVPVPARQILSLNPGRVVAAVPASAPVDLNPSASVSRASVGEEAEESGEAEEARY